MKWLGSFEFLSRGKFLQYAFNGNRFSPSIYKCFEGTNFWICIGHLFYVGLCYFSSKIRALKSSKANGILDLMKRQRQEIRHRILSKAPPMI